MTGTTPMPRMELSIRPSVAEAAGNDMEWSVTTGSSRIVQFQTTTRLPETGQNLFPAAEASDDRA
jgi:hypothetical protein